MWCFSNWLCGFLGEREEGALRFVLKGKKVKQAERSGRKLGLVVSRGA